MRVVGGKARGTKLQHVPGDGTRPALDRVRTALFDILRPDLPGIRILDCYAGTGAIGIEALSQGAEHCIFCDIAAKAVATIKKNVEKTKLEDQAEVRHTDAFKYLRNTSKSFDLIYIDPPRHKDLWTQTLQTIAERPDLVNEGGILICQMDPKEYEALNLSEFAEYDQRTYGNTLLAFYKKV